MTAIILACLLALALATFALQVGLGLSWVAVAIIDLLFAALLVVAVLWFLGSKFRDHLIDDLSLMWKRWSMQIAGVQFTSAIAYWAMVPAEWKAAVPPWAYLAAIVFFGAAAWTAGGIKQANLTPPQA